MAFQLKKISDVGASHPVVARLGPQTGELLKWVELDKASKEAIGELYIMKLTPRLVRCEAAAKSIKEKMEADTERVRAAVAEDPRLQEIPYVIGLDGLVEDFLYEAKNYLRDLVAIFRAAYGATFQDASVFADVKGRGDSRLTLWAKKQFGAADPLVQFLKSEIQWTTELVQKRNAVEHPGGNAGTLVVHNIRMQVNPPGLVPPTWQRTGTPESDILGDMAVLNHNLLTLAEDLLADLVIRTTPFKKQIAIYELPEDRRDPACPVRLNVNLSPEIAAKLPSS